MSHVIYKNRSVIQDFGTGKTLAEITRVSVMPYHLTLDILSINSVAKNPNETQRKLQLTLSYSDTTRLIKLLEDAAADMARVTEEQMAYYAR